MKEIEAKILEIDRRTVEKKLCTLGAKKIFEGAIDVLYFDTLNTTLKKQGIVLRLRRKGETGELTLKKNLLQKRRAKRADEIETAVDFKTAKNILQLLGYTEQSRMKKYRIEYVLDNAHIEIDKIPGIPWFLEIEAPSEKKITALAQKLGFQKSDCKPWWWKDVKKHYKK